MVKPKAVLSLLVPILCGACTTQPQPPAVDLEAEKQQIRQLTHDWYDAENRKDLDAIMGFMADGMIGEFPGMPLLEGKEALRGVLEPMLESMVSITGGPMTVVVSGDGTMAYQFGTSTAIFAGPDGEVEDPQKFLFVWQKMDGEWKAVAGASSSDVSM